MLLFTLISFKTCTVLKNKRAIDCMIQNLVKVSESQLLFGFFLLFWLLRKSNKDRSCFWHFPLLRHQVFSSLFCARGPFLDYFEPKFANAFLILSILIKTSSNQEPWSSGYGRRLVFQRSSVRIPALYTGWTHLFVVKIVFCVWKDEIKWKRGRGWPIFKEISISSV